MLLNDEADDDAADDAVEVVLVAETKDWEPADMVTDVLARTQTLSVADKALTLVVMLLYVLDTAVHKARYGLQVQKITSINNDTTY